MCSTMIQTELKGKVPVKVWTKDIEEQAAEQLKNLAALPFIILELFVLALLMAFPILATGLPDLMTG